MGKISNGDKTQICQLLRRSVALVHEASLIARGLVSYTDAEEDPSDDTEEERRQLAIDIEQANLSLNRIIKKVDRTIIIDTLYHKLNDGNQ